MEYLNNGSVVVQVIGKQYVRKSAVARHKGMHTRDLIKSDRGVFSKYDQFFAIQFKNFELLSFSSSLAHRIQHFLIFIFYIMPFTFHLIGATLHRKYIWETIPILRQHTFEHFQAHPPYVSMNSTERQQKLPFFLPHPPLLT